jgi:hypothetical protein
MIKPERITYQEVIRLHAIHLRDNPLAPVDTHHHHWGNNVKTTVAVGSAVGPLLPGICNAFFEVGAENRPQGTKLVMRLAKAF